MTTALALIALAQAGILAALTVLACRARSAASAAGDGGMDGAHGDAPALPDDLARGPHALTRHLTSEDRC